MHLGLSSYAYGWAIGVRGFPQPDAPLTAFGLLDRAAGFGVRVLQIADNLPLDGWSTAQLERLTHQAADQAVTLELGVRGILNLPAQIALASRLGARVLRTVIDSAGHHPELDEIVARLRAVAPECERRSITLAIENHDRFKATVLEEIFQSVASPHVGLCLDTANSLGCMEGPDHLLAVLGPRVVNLHIKDVCIHRLPHQFGFTVEGRPAGQGQLDIPALVETLGHPSHAISAILELWPAPEATLSATLQKEAAWVEQSIRYLRTLIPD